MPFPFSTVSPYYQNQKTFFLMPGPTDMRKSIFALSMEVYASSKLDPFSGNYFVFMNKRRNIIKIIYYHNRGLCMFQKNLGKRKVFSNMVYSYYIKLKFNFMMSILDS